ncbi:hypothetical protein AN189_15270 [Loktanella sp. 3ANDIMAR09]|uniref:MarR family winged helix-turn-helix transcriptional regulator n=1 Tax=Loktanella sp. 3ANDIMAR09 TaxID=1225657 RepID=UPI00070853E4|nr:MarR family transcriptional regulator [Loktanella sp. 3ANDIMAR09]KQI67525.1 hypothetical protein AN189_15270 [Loktanella sp. 3ANDIMAR09]
MSDPETDPEILLRDFLGYHLKRAYVTVHADFRDIMGDAGLSTRVFSALAMVVGQQGITQSELARALGVERSGMVALIDELEGADLIRREPVPGDRRVQALQPTDRGVARFDELVALVRAHEARCFAGLDDTEKDMLLHLLHKVRMGGVTT